MARSKARELVASVVALMWLAGTAPAQPAGPLVAFGQNGAGQLNVPSGNFIAVTGSAQTGAGIRADGTIAVWGDPVIFPPMFAIPPGTFRFIDGGTGFYLAIRTDDTVAAWGYNFWGEATPPPGQFRKVSGGWKHSVGIRTDGTLAYWGLTWGGSVPAGNDFVDVAAGEEFTLAVRSNGTVHAWGQNTFGQLNVPPGIYVAVEAGQRFGAALKSDGLVVLWGENAALLLGKLATTPVSRISAINAALLALKPDGTLCATTNASEILPSGRFVGIGCAWVNACFAIAACYANCDGSTSSPVLTANDFVCFINAYASSSSAANCDGSTTLPSLTANDFLCFINRFAAGCG